VTVMGRIAVLGLLVIYLPLIAPAKLNLSGIAAGTTVAVNAGEIAQWVRHPIRQTKKTAKQVKAVAKGKK